VEAEGVDPECVFLNRVLFFVYNRSELEKRCINIICWLLLSSYYLSASL